MPIRDGINMSDEDAALYDQYQEAADYHQRLQQIFKIKLNSLYGALSNKHFRFFNLSNGESTTATGREILLHQCAKVNEKVLGKYDCRGPVVLAGDTDSVGSQTMVSIDGNEKTIEATFSDFISRGYSIIKDGKKELIMTPGHKTPTMTDAGVIEKSLFGIYRHKTAKRRFRVTGSDGQFVDVTIDHSIMVLRDGHLLEIKPLDLLSTDNLIIASINNLPLISDIVSVIELPENEEYVYDLIMEDPQYPYFFGNNILVHNSCYFSIRPDAGMSVEEIIAKADAVADYVNASFKPFMQEQFLCSENFDGLIRCVREVVAARAILIKKKKYIFRVIDAEGHRCDKIKSTGVDIKKTTIPKPISKKLNEFIERLLKGEDWDVDIAPDIVRFKNDLEAGIDEDIGDDIMILGSPMGVKNVDKFTREYDVKGDKANLPGHVAGSIHWNMMLDVHNDKASPRIMSGMKIRVFYLTQTFGRFKNIAVPGDIDVLPDWFINEFVPLIDRKLQLQKLVDGPIKNIIKAIGKEVPTNQSLIVNQLLVF